MTILSFCVGCSGSIEDDQEYAIDGPSEAGDTLWHADCWAEHSGSSELLSGRRTTTWGEQYADGKWHSFAVANDEEDAAVMAAVDEWAGRNGRTGETRRLVEIRFAPRRS